MWSLTHALIPALRFERARNWGGRATDSRLTRSFIGTRKKKCFRCTSRNFSAHNLAAGEIPLLPCISKWSDIVRRSGKWYIRVVEYIFSNEKKIRDAVFAARNDIQRCQVRGSGVGNPTESAALNNVTPLRLVQIDGDDLRWPEKWLTVIDATRENFRYDNERTVIMADMGARIDYRMTCAKLTISKSTLFEMRQDVLQYGAMCAASMGLIKMI